MSEHPRAEQIAAAVKAGFVLDRVKALPALIGRPPGFPVRRRPRRHLARRCRAHQRRRPHLQHGRRHGRGLHDRARPRTGAPRQARAGRHGRRRAADEPRLARHHRRAEPAQPLRRSASTTATTARPATRRATPASASISRRSPPAPASSARCTIETESDIAAGARMIREGNGSSFVLLRVKPTDPPTYKRDLNPATCRQRFRTANMRG